ncbi:MAG: alcohol dehydrogenase [Gammaproteobacteria bacterium]|jgi:dTDP-glucose pyrophosphorylase/predicted transcriptional regulator|nr:alcohol dehydrogenase [Gammaproteobacteria bacterium]
MSDWKTVAVKPESTILQAIETIDKSGLRVALVVDSDEHLLGIVTDGDVRRGLLKQINMASPVTQIMQDKPIVAFADTDPKQILAIMQNNNIYHIPVVDKNHKVLSLLTLEEIIHPKARSNWVVLMAGGLGERLRPLTNDCPKPMLKVAGKPILHIILDGFINAGFHNFYIAVNYKAKMIEDYFGDGSQFGANIRYLREESRLGTAGALSLLPEPMQEAFIVMNGDLLTKVNFQSLMEFHDSHEAFATMAVREYDFQVPYGVVELKDSNILKIIEKPIHSFFVSAGIYVLSPEVQQLISSQQFLDMPSLFEAFIKNQKTAISFPVREYWLDIGHINDFNRAEIEFTEYF